MQQTPYFSVIVPTHNRPVLLRRALQSIKSQDLPAPMEVILVSDVIDQETDRACADILEKSFPAKRENPNELADGLVILEAGE